MNEEKRKRLEEKGFKVASIAEFLELTQEEEEIIDQRIKESQGHSTPQAHYRDSAKSGIRGKQSAVVEFGKFKR